MTLRPLLILVTVLLAVTAVYQYGAAVVEINTNNRNYVYNVCNSARFEVLGTSEQSCAQAQDETQTEFLCSHRNNRPDNICWVEGK